MKFDFDKCVLIPLMVLAAAVTSFCWIMASRSRTTDGVSLMAGRSIGTGNVGTITWTTNPSTMTDEEFRKLNLKPVADNQHDANQWWTNKVVWVTNSVMSITNSEPKGHTNFLTISNRTYIDIKDDPGYSHTYLFYFTDDEWWLLTNYYREFYTGTMRFKFYGPITNNPSKP